MAETAGLVVGVVALAGLFKDCVDLFSCISATKSLGRDYEVLNTKLDIEKTLLLQWVDRVQLLNPDQYDSRLDNKAIQKTVSRTLSCIRQLLSESVSLRHTYGMEQAEEQSPLSSVISEPRWRHFQREYAEFRMRVHSTQRETSLKQRIYWVIKDKERFGCLVHQLSDFVAKLNDIVPPADGLFAAMVKSDLGALQSLREVQMVLQAAKETHVGMAALASLNIDERCQTRILERLWYRRIDDRRNNIANAHFKTMQWALESPQSKLKWDDLSQWLRSGSGIYWISGKAGSGKSTLMKLLYQHAKTRALLGEWASGQGLIMASFFFWHLGAPEQNTHDGLSRGLLYHILEADPSLIPRLLPNMWREAHRADASDLSLPSAPEMVQAFCNLRAETTKARFCFFIDGLDEYSGHLARGIDFVRDLATGNTIKVIVSSRPVTSCFQAFSHKPNLQLQELTKDDIKVYVNDTVGSHPYMEDLQAADPTAVGSILEAIVYKASGVFLWVVLACRSLLDGFDAFDYPEELRRRVDELPPELEDLFKHMLNNIESRYRNQAARFLRVCYEKHVNAEAKSRAQGSSSVTSNGVYTLGLALLDEHEMNLGQFPVLRELPMDERERKCRVFESRLRSRCCGLLEVHQDRRCFCDACDAALFSDAPDKPNYGLLDSNVEFMHRTVFDFLNTPNVWDSACLQTDEPDFDPNHVLSRMSLHLVYIYLQDKCETRVSASGLPLRSPRV
ncbi:hypothetical protein DL764_004545 [Monosporascus ibericus]|uniref:Prion-inhibition and propagation HeLo domain-containing protein n=1 Tax=Monosporascus ibericus TaxID=155417 RepID=A0A4Q4TE54_9PEZI|nr:hypothetical protein DL764_004545 [Monosporascus ibericus]